MLNEAVIAALFASDLPAYLWQEVYMAMCYTQILVPSNALQRERRKVIKRHEEYEQEEMKTVKACPCSARSCAEACSSHVYVRCCEAA